MCVVLVVIIVVVVIVRCLPLGGFKCELLIDIVLVVPTRCSLVFSLCLSLSFCLTSCWMCPLDGATYLDQGSLAMCAVLESSSC
jgi:hypothetical protein